MLTGTMTMRLEQTSVDLARRLAGTREQLPADAELLALHALLLRGDHKKDPPLAGAFLHSEGQKRLGA